MKIFLIVFGIVVYIFIGVLCYWISILIDYKKSKSKNSLNYWLNEFNSDEVTKRKQNYFWFSAPWIITLPIYAVILLFYFITCQFSNIIKKILKIDIGE
jgi:hypothetical protein